MKFLIICSIFFWILESQAHVELQNLNVDQLRPKILKTLPSLEAQTFRVIMSKLITRLQKVKKYESLERQINNLRYLRL